MEKLVVMAAASLAQTMSRREIHHIALKVGDLAAAERFYIELLQLPLMRYQNDESGQKRAIWIELDRLILMLEKTAMPSTKNPTVIALAIQANQRHHWIERLKSHGVLITGTSDYSIYFNDHEGNPLALSHYPDKA